MKATNQTSQIKRFLAGFPDNATTWSQATEEIRDIARTAKEYINDYEDQNIEAHDFKSIKTPAQWNATGKAYILSTYAKMNERTKESFNQYMNQFLTK